MTESVPRHRVLPIMPNGAGISRRRFLAGLGVLAGAGALGPILGRTPPAGSETIETSRPGLGTWIRIRARGDYRMQLEHAVDRAFAAIARVDAQMSIHRADSQLARVNRAAGSDAVAVDGDVLDVVERACAAAAMSGGAYDPTILPLMRAFGYYRDDGDRYPSDREIARALERMGWRQVAVDRARGTLALSRAGAGLDLGSIGKGWAVDRAVDALRAEGVRSALVDVGGNLYGLGTPDALADGWAVGVLHPVTRVVDRVFTLRDCAVATSGNYEQYRILSGVRVGHLFDARRGRPAEGHLSASVQAPTGVESDVLSTAAFLLGPSAIQSWPHAESVHFIG